jgi:hypothetical protein
MRLIDGDGIVRGDTVNAGMPLLGHLGRRLHGSGRVGGRQDDLAVGRVPRAPHRRIDLFLLQLGWVDAGDESLLRSDRPRPPPPA